MRDAKMASTTIKISKIALHIGESESVEKLQKAEKLLQELSGQKPLKTYAKNTISEWNVKKFAPIGVKVTMRGEKARAFLARAFDAVENKVKEEQFDARGNLSFGIKEYIEIPDTKYDPDIGMFGLDVSVNLSRPGYSITRRAIKPSKLPKKAIITKEEAKNFFEGNFKVKVVAGSE